MISVGRETFATDPWRIIGALNSYAIHLGHLRRFDEGIETCEEAIGIAEKYLSTTHLALRRTYENMAWFKQELGDNLGSRECYLKLIGMVGTDRSLFVAESEQVVSSLIRSFHLA
jgi:hypothetical protein